MADLYASDSRGVYIPQYFAETVKRDCVSGVSDGDWKILEYGPEHEHYWDTWNKVNDNAVINSPDGRIGFLYQNGDLWVVWGESDPDYENLMDVC